MSKIGSDPEQSQATGYDMGMEYDPSMPVPGDSGVLDQYPSMAKEDLSHMQFHVPTNPNLDSATTRPAGLPTN